MSKWFCGVPPALPPEPSSVRAGISGHHAAIVSICGLPSNDGANPVRGIGILIHPTLVLTTHSTVPSAACLKDAHITFCYDVVSSLSYVRRRFLPEIFFQTNVDLDLTVASCELILEPEVSPLVLDTSRLRRRALRRGRRIFALGCQVRDASDLVAIFDGTVASFTGDCKSIKFLQFRSAGDQLCMPGSAGFDEFGNFAFMISKPPRVHEDPYAVAIKAAAANLFGSHCKPSQWGTTVYAIREWLEPLWRMNRDKLFRSPPRTWAGIPPATYSPSAAAPVAHVVGQRTASSMSAAAAAPVAQVVVPRKASSVSVEAPAAEEGSVKPVEYRSSMSCEDLALLFKEEEEQPGVKSVAVEAGTAEGEEAAAAGEDLEVMIMKPCKKAEAADQRRAAKIKAQEAAKTTNRRGGRKKGGGRRKRAERERARAGKLPDQMAKAVGSASVQTEDLTAAGEAAQPEKEAAGPVVVSRFRGRADEGVQADENILGPARRKAPAGGPRRAPRERWGRPANLELMRGAAGSSVESSPSPTRRLARSASSREIPTPGPPSEPAPWPTTPDSSSSYRLSRSAQPSRAPTPPRHRQYNRQLPPDDDADSSTYPVEVEGDDLASLFSGGSSTANGGSSTANGSSPAVYHKPTISYMQKRNLTQRDSLSASARRASSSALPRWV